MDELLCTEGLGELASGTVLRCRSPTGNPFGCLCREGDLSPLCCRATLLNVMTQSTSSPANTVDWVKWTDTRMLLGRFNDMADLTNDGGFRLLLFTALEANFLVGVLLIASAFWSKIWAAVEGWEQFALSLKDLGVIVPAKQGNELP
jgi:hypothetical protein